MFYSSVLKPNLVIHFLFTNSLLLQGYSDFTIKKKGKERPLIFAQSGFPSMSDFVHLSFVVLGWTHHWPKTINIDNSNNSLWLCQDKCPFCRYMAYRVGANILARMPHWSLSHIHSAAQLSAPCSVLQSDPVLCYLPPLYSATHPTWAACTTLANPAAWVPSLAYMMCVANIQIQSILYSAYMDGSIKRVVTVHIFHKHPDTAKGIQWNHAIGLHFIWIYSVLWWLWSHFLCNYIVSEICRYKA